VQALKPVISGFDAETVAESDTAILLQALGRDPTLEAIAELSPWRFAAPLSPDMAAAREGRDIDFDALSRFCSDAIGSFQGMTLIEGVGGVMVPLTDSKTVVDWISALQVPAVLVVGSYLGTLSHTLTAHAVLTQRRIPVAAVVISESEENPVPLAETEATLARFLPKCRILSVSRNESGDTLACRLFNELA
jgi:dethiobiotin synthetase